MLLYGIFNSAGYGIKGFIPRYSLPFAFPLLPGSFQWIFEPVRVVNMLNTGESLGAHGSARQRIWVALDMDYNPVFYGNFNPAAAMAAFAGG
jgi:hypothetical protein